MAEGADRLVEGSIVAGYRITHRLGGGGMGTVYAAEQPQIGKRVAIKVLRRDLAHDPDSVRRFEREARAANEIEHPGIVDVFAFGALEDGRPYLVMSLLEGKSLGEEISERGKLPPEEAWRIGRAVGEALAAAHARGVIHRDLKPDNVFLERVEGGPARVRLLDLGLAKLLADAAAPDGPDASPMKLTKTGVPIGTPIYMAPEQWWGGDVDERVDQYALGVTLFEMLAGVPPFRSQQFVELAQDHLHKAPPSLAEGGTAPAAIDAFVHRLLAKAPADRFPSIEEALAAGDAAFGAEPALDDTEIASTSLSRSLARAPAAPAGRFLWALAALAVAGPLALVALGYAGENKRDAFDWWKTTGPPLPVILAGYAGGLGAIAFAARKRAAGATFSAAPWVFALVTAAAAALGTHVGWRKVDSAVERLAAPKRFEIMHMGMFELLLSRFIGFYLAALLLVAIAASAGLSRGPPQALQSRHLERLAFGFFTLAAAGAGALGLGSIALAAGAGALVTALSWLTAPRAPSAESAFERATAAILACALAFAVGVARVEAREAALWNEQPTRAARATEIIAVDAERSLTLWAGAALVAIAALVELLKVRRDVRGPALRRPGPRILAVAGTVALLVGADVVLRVQLAGTRSRLHDSVESQFALFANLEPPTAESLDRERYAPHDAPALQIARNSVAVDARPIAPLAATEFSEGVADVGREISRALASRAARGQEESRLAVSIDRVVSWSTAARLLAIARRSGAVDIELLFTLGPALDLPADAPQEARWVLASDFVALPVVLGDDGLTADSGARYEEVAAEIIRRATSGEQPVRIAIPLQ